MVRAIPLARHNEQRHTCHLAAAQAGHDGDEDDDSWVREQIRRGARAPVPPAPPPRAAPARGGVAGPAAAPGVAAPEEIAAAGVNVISALQQGLARLQVDYIIRVFYVASPGDGAPPGRGAGVLCCVSYVAFPGG
jgi:hypothetical protein